MKLSDRNDVRRALVLLDVPVSELRTIEAMRGGEAEAALEKFKVRIATAFRIAVRSEHHPDHGSDPADIERRAENFRLIRSFSESVKTWSIKSRPRPAMPLEAAFVSIDINGLMDLTQEMLEQLLKMERAARRARNANEKLRRAAEDLERAVFTTKEPAPRARRRTDFRTAPSGTDVESRSGRDGRRIHRVRKVRYT